RAVYDDADIYLLDDTFSALDARVGKEIFENCVLNLLRNKCVLLITHQLGFLKHSTEVLVLKNGKEEAKGTYSELKDLVCSNIDSDKTNEFRIGDYAEATGDNGKSDLSLSIELSKTLRYIIYEL